MLIVMIGQAHDYIHITQFVLKFTDVSVSEDISFLPFINNNLLRQVFLSDTSQLVYS